MSRKEEAEKLLRKGNCPSEIADEMSISIGSAIQYLCTRVGEGSLRLSDIYFSWPPEVREILQRAGRGKYPNDDLLRSNRLCREELELFNSLRGRGVFSGDMYEYISATEVAIHGLVRKTLEQAFGQEESGWWRMGIPSSIRADCASCREKDDEPSAAPYAYTNLIDLSTVISKNWTLFQNVVPREYTVNRKQLEKDLRRLNRIRNVVMHPVKARKWSEADFEFVRQISGQFKVMPVI